MSQDECLGRAARHGAGWSEMRVDVFFGRERFLFDSGKKCFVGTLVIKVRMPCLTPPLPVSPSRAKLWAEKGEGLGAVYVGARRGGGGCEGEEGDRSQFLGRRLGRGDRYFFCQGRASGSGRLTSDFWFSSELLCLTPQFPAHTC